MPRFSIVVTTTDRPVLLAPCVKAVLDLHFDDFELIVSDNFSKIPATEILAGFDDKRIRIIRTDRRLAAADHWEFVWDHVTGEYALFLGDDNALHPEILAFADKAIRDHDLHLLTWRNAFYFHADWNLNYAKLPNCGNVLSFEPGTTGGLFAAPPDQVLRAYCNIIGPPEVFPCMLNFLFRKADGDRLRELTGRVFWAPAPDLGLSFNLLGITKPGKFGFLDAFGAIGGRSRDSNVATQMSRGKASRRVHDYLAEHEGQDLIPHHDAKFFCHSNIFAALIAQAKAILPDYFASYDFDRRTLAVKIIHDMYVDCVVAWVEDPGFLREVDRFFDTLPKEVAAEVRAYRDRCHAHFLEVEAAGRPLPECPRNAKDAGSHWWLVDRTLNIDMSALGSQDIAGAARHLPQILKSADPYSDITVATFRHHGLLGEQLGTTIERLSGVA